MRQRVEPVQSEDMKLLRDLVGHALAKRSDAALQLVLNHIGGDVELAAIALTMVPRPRWVSDLLETVSA